MKRFFVLLASLSAALVLAAPASAVPPPGSCGVGGAVSQATRALGGIGRVAHELGFANVGNEVIQPFHAGIKATCKGPNP